MSKVMREKKFPKSGQKKREVFGSSIRKLYNIVVNAF